MKMNLMREGPIRFFMPVTMPVVMHGMSVLTALFFAFSATAAATEATRSSRLLNINALPNKITASLKKAFPYLSEREATLAEIDEVVRFLMRSGQFSNVDVVERGAPGGGKELVVQVSLLRYIQDVRINGNNALSTSEVLRTLAIGRGQVFERKNLLASAEELRKNYESLGYHNAHIEINFAVPNSSEVIVDVTINEHEPVRISDVVIESADPDLGKRLTKLSRYLKGHVFTDDELLEFQKTATQELINNGYLTAKIGTPQITPNPDRTLAKITYAIENPWKFEFSFAGNLHFSEAFLIHKIQEEKLAGAANPIPEMAEKIRRAYQAVGFANVEVGHKEKLIESGHRMKVHFEITENPRVRIRNIEITGNISRPPAYYAQFLKTSSSDLIGRGYYIRRDIDESARRLVIELQNQGFLRAKVQSQRAEYSSDKSFVTLSLSIDEGPLTQIRQIRIEGAESFPKAKLLEVLQIKAGSALGLKELEDSLTAIRAFYRSEGFLEMRILNDSEQSRIVTYNEGNTQATVVLQIYEGPQVRVGSVILQGNSFTRDYVILRELPFAQGDVLTPEKIEETTFRLQKLNLFSNVSLRTLEEGTNISERTVIIDVSERDPGTFIARIGGSNENTFTIRGLGSISYSNLWGTGRGVSVRVEPKYSTDPRISYVEHTITASYIEPYIFNDRNRGRVNLIREQQLFEIRNDRTKIQEANTVGFLIDRDLTRNIRLTLNAYSFSNQKQFDRFSYETLKTVNIAKVGPFIEFDYRDDVFNPTRGTYSFLNLEYSDPLLGSSKDQSQVVNFFKATGSATLYQSLFGRRDLVWVNQLRSGYVANLSNERNAGVPVQEAFFLGGRSSVRGFVEGRDEEKIPNIWDVGLGKAPEGLSTFTVKSDSYFHLFKTELWFPISGVLGGTLFYDAGAVFINQPDVNIKQPYRDAIGTGLRVLTPVGPLNLQIGWKLNRRVIHINDDGSEITEEPFAIHLSFGVL